MISSNICLNLTSSKLLNTLLPRALPSPLGFLLPSAVSSQLASAGRSDSSSQASLGPALGSTFGGTSFSPAVSFAPFPVLPPSSQAHLAHPSPGADPAALCRRLWPPSPGNTVLRRWGAGLLRADAPAGPALAASPRPRQKAPPPARG